MKDLLKEFRVIEINNFHYKLEDNKGEIISLNIEFFDIEVKVNNLIYMYDKFFDKNYEEYSTFYRFGKLNNIYGRKLSKENKSDIIIIKNEKEILYLQRYYG